MLRRLPPLALLVVAAAIGSTAPAALAQENMATVHGTIYDLWTFTPLDNVWIEVYSDSTLFYRELHHGTYSLSLSPGSYTLMAKHYSGGILVYDAEENNITLQENDNLTLDLIMFPAFGENELPENYDIIPEEDEAGTRNMWFVLGVALVLVIAGAIAFYYRKILPKKKLPKEEIRAPPPVKVVGLPDDIKEVMNVIRASGGRINQVELRQKLPHSEAKVSLMIADLEDRGLVRKIKKGRGNIIVLTELEK